MSYTQQPAFQDLYPLQLDLGIRYESYRISEANANAMLADNLHPGWHEVLKVALSSVIHFEVIRPTELTARTGSFKDDFGWRDFQANVFMPPQALRRITSFAQRFHVEYTPLATINTQVTPLPLGATPRAHRNK